MSATHVEKSTVNSNQHNAVSSGAGPSMNAASAPAASALSALEVAAAAARAQQMELSDNAATDIRFCGVDDPTCESCQ